MASSSATGGQKGVSSLSPKSARTRLAEALGKLEITEEEATPLMIDDRDQGGQPKWALTGKVLYRNTLHLQTISNALRPAWGT